MWLPPRAGHEPGEWWLPVPGRSSTRTSNRRHEEVRDIKTRALLSEREYLVPFDEWLRGECPFAQPGDRLWARETWRPWYVGTCGRRVGVHYRTDDRKVCLIEEPTDDDPIAGSIRDMVFAEGDRWPAAPGRERWRSRLQMPRWASRIELEVLAVGFRTPEPGGRDCWRWAIDWERAPGNGPALLPCISGPVRISS
jgi:hypothetical protein